VYVCLTLRHSNAVTPNYDTLEATDHESFCRETWHAYVILFGCPIIGDICHSWYLIIFLHASYDVNVRQHFENSFNGHDFLKRDCLRSIETCILKVYKNKFEQRTVFDFPEKFYSVKRKVGNNRDKEKKKKNRKGMRRDVEKVILVHENVNIQKSSFMAFRLTLEVQEKVHLREENRLLHSITEVSMRSSWKTPREH